MYVYIYIYVCIYIILSVIVFSSLSFYGEWTIPGTKRQPAILNLIDGGFLISSNVGNPVTPITAVGIMSHHPRAIAININPIGDRLLDIPKCFFPPTLVLTAVETTSYVSKIPTNWLSLIYHNLPKHKKKQQMDGLFHGK